MLQTSVEKNAGISVIVNKENLAHIALPGNLKTGNESGAQFLKWCI